MARKRSVVETKTKEGSVSRGAEHNRASCSTGERKISEVERLRSMYQVNQLAWVKKSGYPWWPAQVVNPATLTVLKEGDVIKMPKTAICMVVFFDAAQSRTAVTHPKNILPYFQYYEKNKHLSKKEDFQTAVAEANKYGTAEIREMEHQMLKGGYALSKPNGSACEETNEATKTLVPKLQEKKNGNAAKASENSARPIRHDFRRSRRMGSDHPANDASDSTVPTGLTPPSDAFTSTQNVSLVTTELDHDIVNIIKLDDKDDIAERNAKRVRLSNTPPLSTSPELKQTSYSEDTTAECSSSVAGGSRLTYVDGDERDRLRQLNSAEPIGIIGLSAHAKAMVAQLLQSKHKNLFVFAVDERERGTYRGECADAQCDVIVVDSIIELLQHCRLMIGCCSSQTEVDKMANCLVSWEETVPGSIKDLAARDWAYVETFPMDAATIEQNALKLGRLFPPTDDDPPASSFSHAVMFPVSTASSVRAGVCLMVGGGPAQLMQRVTPVFACCGPVCYAETVFVGCSLLASLTTFHAHQIAGMHQAYRYLETSGIGNEFKTTFRKILACNAWQTTTSQILGALTSDDGFVGRWSDEWIRRLEAAIETGVRQKIDVTLDAVLLQKLRRMKEGDVLPFKSPSQTQKKSF